MLTSSFTEDIFLAFYSLIPSGRLNVQHQDFSPILSFHSKIEDGNQLTKNQADYIMKILEKYKNLAAVAGVDYRDALATSTWRQPFRVLDLSKRIYVEKTAEGKLEICLKFPFQMKKEFDDEINVNLPNSNRVSHWDHEDKVRRLNFYEYNLIALYEFAVKRNFEIDDSFMNVMADVEEMWQDSESIIPHSVVSYLGVELKNAPPEVREWWVYTHTQSYYDDLLLAKSMGYVLKKLPTNMAEKIAASPENNFWIKDSDAFFSLIANVRGKVCILLDRTSDTLSWLQTFVADADRHQISRDEIKVCFRESKDAKNGVNDWIKMAGVGGKVDTGRILIFESKPAKWLFKDNEYVTMLVTNNIYPPTNSMAKDWFSSHPCVVYLGATKPTEQRGQRIVEL